MSDSSSSSSPYTPWRGKIEIMEMEERILYLIVHLCHEFPLLIRENRRSPRLRQCLVRLTLPQQLQSVRQAGRENTNQ